jgi:hypothetical protein
MSGRRNALFAGALLLAIACVLNLGFPAADAHARARLLEDEVDGAAADTRPSEPRRVRAAVDDDADDVDVRTEIRPRSRPRSG